MSVLLVLSPNATTGLYELRVDWPFFVDGVEYIIPLGFQYDGASIPVGAWYLTYSPFNPIVMEAALEHDWLCVARPAGVSSKRAAEHFRDKLVHANAVKREAMYRAVLWFGPKWGADWREAARAGAWTEKEEDAP